MTPRSARSALTFLIACAAGGVCFADGLTDRQIERAAARSFVFKDQLQGRVFVLAHDGIALLSGRVDNQDERILAEDTVNLLPNVRSVDNQIEVGGPPIRRSDTWIALRVKAALLLHREVRVSATRVTVTHGEVVLDGRVATTAQKWQTESYARGVEGVRAVLNNLTVDAPVPSRPRSPPTFAGDSRAGSAPAATRTWDDPSVTAQVRSEFTHHHLSVGSDVSITTQAGVVTMSGEVGNQDEKDLIDRAAHDAPGVRAVVNHVHVRGQ